MAVKKKKSYFWASYTDLMTSLFFVMLVLYVLTFAMLKREKKKLEDYMKEIEVDAKKYREILEVEEEVKKLEESEDFVYEEEFKRLIPTRQINFKPQRYDIPNEDKKYLLQIGKQVEELIKNDEGRDDVKYLIIIEGMASKDSNLKSKIGTNEYKVLEQYNYELSYRRAYSLYKFWLRMDLKLNTDASEVLISGSGIGGVGRDVVEAKNQRFLIQIIPKINAK